MKKHYYIIAVMVGIACLSVGGIVGVFIGTRAEAKLRTKLKKKTKKLKKCEIEIKAFRSLRHRSAEDISWTHVNITKILRKTDSILNSLPVCDTAAIDAVRDLARQNAEFQRRKLTGCLPSKLNCKHPVNVMECRVEIFHNDRSNEYLICRIVKKK